MSHLLRRGEFPELFVPEVINGCDVHKVAADVCLDVACSPVLPLPHSIEARGAEVLDEGVLYRVWLPERRPEPAAWARLVDRFGDFMEVEAADMRVMRARWLLNRDQFMATWNRLGDDYKALATRVFFLGKAPWVPPAGSPLDALIQGALGSPITIKRHGDAPVDFAALMRTLSTPGAEVPAVCPVVTAPPAPEPPEPQPPVGSVLPGDHAANKKACGFWKVNDPASFDVAKTPANFWLCEEHWARVRTLQGGRYKTFGPQREYVGGRYR